MTHAVSYTDHTANYNVPSQVRQMSSESFASIIGRLLGIVEITTSNIQIAGQITGADYQPLSMPLARLDFEAALSLKEVAPSTDDAGLWELAEDIVVPFKPKRTVKVTMTMHYAGKLKPNETDLDEDWLD